MAKAAHHARTSSGARRKSPADADLIPRAKVLVIENDPERLAIFRAMFPDRLVVAPTYDRAVEAMSSRRFRAVYIDHDLDDTDRNGQDVAYWMARDLPRSKRPDIAIIHSTNIRGALGVQKTLEAAGFNVVSDPFPPKRFEQVVARASLTTRLHLFRTPFGTWTHSSFHLRQFAAVYLPDPEYYSQRMAGVVSELGREEWAKAKRRAEECVAKNKGRCQGFSTTYAGAEELLGKLGSEVLKGGVFEAAEVMEVPARRDHAIE